MNIMTPALSRGIPTRASFPGCSAACRRDRERLRRAWPRLSGWEPGYRVTVLEKLDAPGGRAYVYRQDGFTFDAGPTIVTAPFLLEELWQLCGRRLADDVELRPVSPFYRIRFDDGEVFEYSGDPDAMRAEVARVSPGRCRGLRSAS